MENNNMKKKEEYNRKRKKVGGEIAISSNVSANKQELLNMLEQVQDLQERLERLEVRIHLRENNKTRK
jgi:ubiquinone biosynthesis protein UbiJ